MDTGSHKKFIVRAPVLNFSLTCESLSTWMFFTMTETTKTQPNPCFYISLQKQSLYIHCVAEYKIYQGHSENLHCMPGAEVFIVCLSEKRELAPSFSYTFLTSSVGKYLGRNQMQKAMQTFTTTNTFPEPPLHFMATFRLRYTYTNWLTGGWTAFRHHHTITRVCSSVPLHSHAQEAAQPFPCRSSWIPICIPSSVLPNLTSKK